MKTLHYQLHLLEPVLVTALEGNPNSAVAFAYIPGSVIRGAVIGQFMRKNRIAELDATDDATRRVFFSDYTQYLNAYPVVNGVRSLPFPNSWHTPKDTPKGEQSPIYDFAWAAEPDRPKNPKGIGGFLTLIDDKVAAASVERFIAVHTQRDRQKGRSISGSGAVYRYDSLAADQEFGGLIICENDADTDWLSEYIYDGLEVQIGGARSAGYGRVRFKNVVLDDGLESRSPSGLDQQLVITLLSDAIVRNEYGEYEPNLASLLSSMARRLGSSCDDFGQVEQAYLGTTLVGGFNRKWGLPLPQTAALSMGSTVVFTRHKLPPDRVDQLMRRGIGERRAEGFGRVGINIYTQPQYEVADVGAPANGKNDQAQIPQMIKLLPQSIARRELSRAIEIALTATANNIEITNPPKSSQINTLRAVIQNVLQQADVDVSNLDTALKHIGERAVTRRQFERARVSGKTLIAWLRETTAETQHWDRFGKEQRIKMLVQFSGVDQDEERRRYNLRLIDAVLAHAAKQTRRKGNSNA